MIDTLTRFLSGIASAKDRAALQAVLAPVFDRLSCATFQSAALRIKGGSASAIVQTNAAWYGVVGGKLVTKATAQDCPALVGTVTNTRFNVFAVFMDSAATLTTVMGVEATTLANVTFPPIPVGKAVVGYVVINPTGTGNFLGGTTNLDDATVAPNAVFINTIGPFDPTILV